ncbi:MAG: hypothetical protein IPM97_05440 [Bdellovibrionaceae bacterium]|nr:hypothetical protein [Pseudobdellovibrionaceae bacterium]
MTLKKVIMREFPVFDINDPARVTSQFSNWSDVDKNYFIPKIVQEISTQGRSANTSNTSLGINRIAKAGHLYLYTRFGS